MSQEALARMPEGPSKQELFRYNSVTFPLNHTHFVQYRLALIADYTKIQSNVSMSNTDVIFTYWLIKFNNYPSTTYTVPGILHILPLLHYQRAPQAKFDALYFIHEETEGRDFE